MKYGFRSIFQVTQSPLKFGRRTLLMWKMPLCFLSSREKSLHKGVWNFNPPPPPFCPQAMWDLNLWKSLCWTSNYSKVCACFFDGFHHWRGVDFHACVSRLFNLRWHANFSRFWVTFQGSRKKSVLTPYLHGPDSVCEIQPGAYFYFYFGGTVQLISMLCRICNLMAANIWFACVPKSLDRMSCQDMNVGCFIAGQWTMSVLSYPSHQGAYSSTVLILLAAFCCCSWCLKPKWKAEYSLLQY